MKRYLFPVLLLFLSVIFCLGCENDLPVPETEETAFVPETDSETDAFAECWSDLSFPLELDEVIWDSPEDLAERIEKTGADEVFFSDGLLSHSDKVVLSSLLPDVRLVWKVALLGMEDIDSGIEGLNISENEITDLDGFIYSLEEMRSLKYIDMCDCGLSNEEMEMLCERFPDIKFVWKVKMSAWTLRTDTVAFSTFCGSPRQPHLTTEDIQVLKYCKDLVALDLGHHSFDDISVIGELTNLKILIIVDDSELFDPTPLSNLTKLQYLEIFCNYNTFNDISCLEPLKDLVDLNMCYDYVRGDIDPILHFPKLERLWVTACSLDYNERARIKEAYPNATVCFDCDDGSTGSGWREHERYFQMREMFKNNVIIDEFFK